MPDHHLLLCGLRLPDDEEVPGRHPRVRKHSAVHPEDQEHVPEVHVQIRDGQCLPLLLRGGKAFGFKGVILGHKVIV